MGTWIAGVVRDENSEEGTGKYLQRNYKRYSYVVVVGQWLESLQVCWWWYEVQTERRNCDNPLLFSSCMKYLYRD